MGRVALFIPADKTLPAGFCVDGKVACAVCTEAITQEDVDEQEVFFATGKWGVYAAHVEHFYMANPATGRLDMQTPDYRASLSLFAVAYGIGEGLATPKRG